MWSWKHRKPRFAGPWRANSTFLTTSHLVCMGYIPGRWSFPEKWGRTIPSRIIFGWSLVNLHVIPGLKPFDPFPFGVLALVVSSESVFLTIFVLISQGRMARQSERRSHLDLQVGMLSEQELTTILQMLQKLCQHMGVNVDSSKQEVQSFAKTTDVHKLASELEDKLPEE